MVRVIEYTIDTDKEQQIYRLITSLTDTALFPAVLLATEYHQRWQVENTIDELKVHSLWSQNSDSFSRIPVKLFKRFTVGFLGIGLFVHLCFTLLNTLKYPLYD